MTQHRRTGTHRKLALGQVAEKVLHVHEDKDTAVASVALGGCLFDGSTNVTHGGGSKKHSNAATTYSGLDDWQSAFVELHFRGAVRYFLGHPLLGQVAGKTYRHTGTQNADTG